MLFPLVVVERVARVGKNLSKTEKMTSKVMNNVNFYTSKISLILPFLCRPKFKIYSFDILHDGYVQHF
jgi:hypothetical protein